MIITSIEEVEKLKPGQSFEVILKDDDGDPRAFDKLRKEYDRVFLAIEKLNTQEDKPSNPSAANKSLKGRKNEAK